MIIVRPITNILFVIYNFVGDFGLAIIFFTILVKLLMWPLVKRQLHQTKLMKKIQPELNKIRENTKGNRQLESIQMMDLYKRHNIKPFRSILSLIIHLPIYIAIFTAIRVIVQPTEIDNLQHRAYDFVQSMDKIQNIITKQTDYLNGTSATFDFHPKLFGLVDLDVSAGFGSVSAVIVLIIAISAAILQYQMTRQQLPSKKSKKSFRQLMKEASSGKEPDQSELNTVVSGQMGKIMPFMMLFIMIYLPGALVLYYLLSTLITIIQQRIIFNQDEDEMEILSADKSIVKNIDKIKEAEVIENKKTGTRITRITAKDARSKNANSQRSKKQNKQDKQDKQDATSTSSTKRRRK